MTVSVTTASLRPCPKNALRRCLLSSPVRVTRVDRKAWVPVALSMSPCVLAGKSSLSRVVGALSCGVLFLLLRCLSA